MANLLDEIKNSIADCNGKWIEKKGIWSFSAIIAERKAFLSRKKLTYTLNLRIDHEDKAVRFSELLTESGSGFSSGGDLDSGMSSGFGFKTETYNTFGGSRRGTIEEQSKQFGKDYSYQFDHVEIRGKIKQIAENAGYKFEYQVMPVK